MVLQFNPVWPFPTTGNSVHCFSFLPLIYVIWYRVLIYLLLVFLRKSERGRQTERAGKTERNRDKKWWKQKKKEVEREMKKRVREREGAGEYRSFIFVYWVSVKDINILHIPTMLLLFLEGRQLDLNFRLPQTVLIQGPPWTMNQTIFLPSIHPTTGIPECQLVAAELDSAGAIRRSDVCLFTHVCHVSVPAAVLTSGTSSLSSSVFSQSSVRQNSLNHRSSQDKSRPFRCGINPLMNVKT